MVATVTLYGKTLLNPGAALTAAGAAPKRSRSARAILSSPVAAGRRFSAKGNIHPAPGQALILANRAMSSGQASSQRSLTSCMPYTDLQPQSRPIRLLSCGAYCPLGTVVDRE